MPSLQSGIETVLRLLTQFGVAVLAVLAELEVWLRSQLVELGVPRGMQTLILLAVAICLALGALRLFGGLIRVAILLFLVLIALQIVLPVIQG